MAVRKAGTEAPAGMADAAASRKVGMAAAEGGGRRSNLVEVELRRAWEGRRSVRGAEIHMPGGEEEQRHLRSGCGRRLEPSSLYHAWRCGGRHPHQSGSRGARVDENQDPSEMEFGCDSPCGFEVP